VENARPIIVVKKKVAHGGHHGGAWKVAYADFVTAMMALFIVLWLMNLSKPVREAIAGYFKDPAGTGEKLGSTMEGQGIKVMAVKDDMPKLKAELEKAISQIPEFDKLKNQIEIKVTAEGLRIEMLESEKGTFFDLGDPHPNDNGTKLLDLLAVELAKLPNKISIEGHTDAKPFSGKRNYGNWELSVDRANSARRLMQQQGLGEKQVAQVRGFADQFLRKPESPFDPSNRRISLIVQYRDESDRQQHETESTMEKLQAPHSTPELQTSSPDHEPLTAKH
jgi:chemotaxis protein MotB